MEDLYKYLKIIKDDINDLWIKSRGMIEFKGGKEDWQRTAEIADKCLHFLMDDEDELVADEERSCYNCRYRRWTSSSFTCLRHPAGGRDNLPKDQEQE